MPGIAEIESVPLIRDIKRTFTLPIPESKIREAFSGFFIKEQDIMVMKDSLNLVEPVLEVIKNLLERNDPDFEEVNVFRAMKLVGEIPEALKSNIEYAHEILGWQEEFIKEINDLFNNLPKIRTQQERSELNDMLNKVFQKILRNSEFTFRFQDIIYEAHVWHMDDLRTIIPKGFLFKILTEEELNKVEFSVIRRRIPRAKLELSDGLVEQIKDIKKGVDKAYEINMKMINWAVLLYSYIKFLRS